MASRLRAAGGDASNSLTVIYKRAMVLERWQENEDDPNATTNPLLRRPLRLFQAPEPIMVPLAEVTRWAARTLVWDSVPSLVKAWGGTSIRRRMVERAGEIAAHRRIDRSPRKRRVQAVLTRAASGTVAEDDGGRRFWIFREGPIQGRSN